MRAVALYANRLEGLPTRTAALWTWMLNKRPDNERSLEERWDRPIGFPMTGGSNPQLQQHMENSYLCMSFKLFISLLEEPKPKIKQSNKSTNEFPVCFL